ncbi:PLDc N-terminal domain-containing protein [Halopseudomonas maritima]|uniref:PLDc N-terminal domain-containing protein n=1 Tax=Halopseudomonas maritima TaxID=2918528 RepID=UPI001EEB9737|nr:PLDc N-terminal domain-containing protein [Halopseudomonas maritima]UJJ31938.1 PLDc N-terminal domain-containing protein [Halopseudomonas maritima]
MNFNTGGGLVGLLILIGDIWAIINILQSGASTGAKLLWILLVVLLPLLGLIIWFVAGPKSSTS